MSLVGARDWKKLFTVMNSTPCCHRQKRLGETLQKEPLSEVLLTAGDKAKKSSKVSLVTGK